MLIETDGGYEEGYRAVTGFWGTQPGSLVADYLHHHPVTGLTVLDVGAGEGKNAAAFARAGASVDALECSSAAIRNGRALFDDAEINWLQADADRFAYPLAYYDVVVCYGLIHCLKSIAAAMHLVSSLKSALKANGTFILVSFNDGRHDLSAHPGFKPLLLPHGWFLQQFEGWEIDSVSNSLLFETHPHNNIPHHHSLTRLRAFKP